MKKGAVCLLSEVMHGFNVGGSVKLFPLHGYIKYVSTERCDVGNEVEFGGHRTPEERACSRPAVAISESSRSRVLMMLRVTCRLLARIERKRLGFRNENVNTSR